MSISALKSSLQSSQASLDILRTASDAQVDLSQKAIKMQAEQEAIAAKIETLGTVVDLYV